VVPDSDHRLVIGPLLPLIDCLPLLFFHDGKYFFS
jgi:hypothetical protein